MATKVFMALLGFTLILAVACGTAEAPNPTRGLAVEPTAVTTSGETSQPTPTPQMAAPPAPAEVEVNPGKVTWMISSFGSERFDYTFTTAGHDYARQVHGFLISSDVEDGRRVLVPGIAKEWEISSDGRTWILTINDGLMFHDGSELTAEDVVWTLQHTMGPQAHEYAAGGDSLTMSRIMEKIEQTGPDQVSVTTTLATPEFPDVISEATGSWVGVVYPKRETLHNDAEELAYDRNPIGAGTVKLVEHTPLEVMRFERFNDYYYQPANGYPIDKRINFQSLDIYLVPEEATRVAVLRSGEGDIVPASLATKGQVAAGGGRLVFGQEGVYFRVRQLGCWKPEFPCSKKEVRQAINYAINKELMRDTLYGGPEAMQVKGWDAVTPSTTGYSPELDPFPFDPEKARQLLADAGYPGGEGFGKLIINTWVSKALPLMPEAAQLAADNLRRELGLDVEVKIGDEAAIKEASSLTEDLHGQIVWQDNETRIDAADTIRNYFGTPDNLARAHSDPELFALVQDTAAVIDRIDRTKALNTLYQQLRDEGYWIPIGYANIPWGVGPRIATWEPYPLANYPSALHTITLK
jgi:peptide/nickel transport system substrate-binding protein